MFIPTLDFVATVLVVIIGVTIAIGIIQSAYESFFKNDDEE